MTSPVGTTSYFYDAAGRLVSMTHPFGETTSWSYDHAGRVTGEVTTTGLTSISTTYTWGVSGQGGDPSTAPAYLRTITQTVGGLSFETYTLTHSYLSQLQQVTGAGVFAETDSFAYDNRGRLTADAEQVQTGGQNYQANGSYTYDLSNNLQGGVNGWTYNSNNQVTNAPAQGGLAGATGLAYDAAGNLTSCNGMTLSYDAWGHLSGVAGTPYGTVTFTYDFAGRRVSKTVSGQTTYYLYEGPYLLAEIDGATGQITRSYTWGALGLVSDRTGTQSRFYLFDAQDNTRALVSATGALLSQGAYTAWGAPFSNNLSPDTPFAWNGRSGVYRDTETGLLLMGARYYAPCIGRFVSRDPISFAGGINLYAYCNGDPINYLDPMGLEGSFLGLRASTWWGIGAGALTFLATGGNIGAAVVVGAGVRGYCRSRAEGHPPSLAIADGMSDGLMAYGGCQLFQLTKGYVLWRLASAGAAEVTGVEIKALTAAEAASNPAETAGEVNSATRCLGGLRPNIITRLPDRITQALPEGEIRTPVETAQARNFFERNRAAARIWWEGRTGQEWPTASTHDEHPRAIKEGGDPLFIEPGLEGPAKPHMNAGDFSRWGKMGGRPRKIRGL